MKTKILTLALSLLFILPVFTQNMKYSRVEIDAKKDVITQLQQLGIPMDAGHLQENKVVVELSSYDLQKVENAGINYNTLIQDVTAFYQKRNKEILAKGVDLLQRDVKDDYPTPDNFELGSMGGCYTHDEVLAELDEMQQLFPDLISSKQPISDFTTHEGRSLYWVRLSDNPNQNEDEPEVLYTGLHHAREPLSMQNLVFYMYYLMENYDSDDNIKQLVDNTEMYFVLVVNPDGYIYNETNSPSGGGMWRKNRRDNGSGEFGVDLNRNYGYMWGHDNSGSSPDPWSETYRGPSAFSEPATQAIKWFCEQHEFLIANNYHTYSNLLLYPWGYEDDLYTPDSALFVEYAKVMTMENGYTYGTAPQILYSTNGDANDWMYGEQDTKPKIMSFTSEVGSGSDGFWPSIDRVVPLCKENMWANLSLARFAGAYAQVTDMTPDPISTITPYIKYNIKRLGMKDDAEYKVFIQPLGNNIIDDGDTIIYNSLVQMQEYSDSIQINLNPNIQVGDSFQFVLSVDNGAYTVNDTITKSYGFSTVIFNDEGNNMNNWTTAQWNTTTSAYVSDPTSITDSPSGNYGDDENNPITLSSPLDLSSADYAELSFWAKWDIENNWDYVQVMVSSDNGVTWIPLQGEYTNDGTGSFQPAGEPVYDGTSDWVLENIDISNYTSDQVLIKFVLMSDGSINDDGFYFDDLQVFSVDQGTDYPVVVAYPMEDVDAEQGDPNMDIDLSLVFHDPNGDNITYSVANNTNPGIAETTLSGEILTLDFSDNINGQTDIEINAEANGTEASDMFTVFVGPQGIIDAISNEIKVQPNPFSEYIRINNLEKNTAYQVIISDMKGKAILKTELLNNNQVNTSQLAGGIYFLKLSGNGHTTIKKIIKL